MGGDGEECSKVCKKLRFSASPARYHAQPEMQTMGQSSLALIQSSTRAGGKGK